MAQILCNRAFLDKSPAVTPLSMIDDMLGKDKPYEFYIIVPTGKIVRKLNYHFIRKYFELYSKPVGQANIYTFSKFVRFLFSKIYQGSSFRVVSDAYRFSLFEEAASNAKLSYFKQGRGKMSQAVLEKLSRVVFGLKEDGIRVEDMQEDLENYSQSDPTIDPDKLSDLHSLYVEYQDLLKGNLLDAPEALNKTVDFIRERKWQLELFRGEEMIKEELFKNQVILLHGFSEFKKTEQELISLFADSKIPVGIHIDYSTKNGPLFGNLEESILYLRSQGFVLSGEIEEKIKTTSDFIRFNLFAHKTQNRSQQLAKMVDIYENETIADEIRNIAAHTKYLITEENFSPSDICICCRKIDEYSALFREIFREYDIPANISDRFQLDNSSIVSSVFAMINTILNEFKIEDLHKALSSNYFKFDFEFDINNLYDIAKANRISGGKRQGGRAYWLKALEQRIINLKQQIDNLQNGSAKDPMKLADSIKELRQTEIALKDFKKISESIPKIQQKLSPNEFADFIKISILGNFNLREQLVDAYLLAKNGKYSSSIEEHRVFEDLERDSRAMAALLDVINEMVFIMNERQSTLKYSLEYYVNKLKNAVMAAKYQISEKQGYGVEVTAIEQIRSIPYEVTFICGLVDGIFPISYSPEVFLGKVLPESEDKHLKSERIHFYQALTNNEKLLNSGNKQIHLSYYKFANEKETIRSPFINALLKICPREFQEELYNVAEIKKGFANNEAESVDIVKQHLPWLEYIYTKKDKLIAYSKSENDETAKFINEDDIKYLARSRHGVFDYSIDTKELSKDDLSSLSGIKDKEVSISQLETFMSCPYKYFAQRSLRLDSKEKYENAMTALEKGNLLHSILHRFFVELKHEQLENGKIEKLNTKGEGQEIAMVVLDQDKYDEYLSRLQELAQQELGEISKYNPFFTFDLNDICGTDANPGLLKHWLDGEFQRTSEGWEYSPAIFELDFGDLSNNSPAAVTISKNIRLKGKIDRIELKQNDNGNYSAVIADYKLTGGTSKTKIQQTKTLQLPLYAVAIKNILSDYYGLQTDLAEGLYYILTPEKKGKLKPEQIVMITPENAFYKKYRGGTSSAVGKKFSIDDILANAIERAQEVVEQISAGVIVVDPEQKACDYCDYQSLCRINEKESMADIA
jgi:ATP-dependent helicase/DNAse subunit B